MSGHELALLHDMVESSIALELGEGERTSEQLEALGIEPKRTRSVAGLRVTSNTARDAEHDPDAATRKEKLLRYRANRYLVTSKLDPVGVGPLAFVPLTAWQQICNDAGLYRFTPRGDMVRLNAASILEEAKAHVKVTAEEKHKKRSALLWRTWAAVVIVSIALGVMVSKGFFLLLVPCVFALLVLGVASLFSDAQLEEREELREIEIARIRELVAAHTQDGTLIRALWPDFNEPGSGAEIRIMFPDPPIEVQERIVATQRAGLDLHIAVVPEAITFKESVADALIGKQREYWDEADRIEALNRDPIVYVVEGTAVAIIDQYGDFPIEEEVMHRVINSEHLV